MRDTIAPSPGDARDRHIEMAGILALADEQEEPYRTLSILLHATGLDLSVALRLERRDVDVSRREIVSKRTKTRRNVARRNPKLADWAWPDVERHIALLTPNANPTMVLDVYGRYRPDETERTAWERRAAEQDTERARSTG